MYGVDFAETALFASFGIIFDISQVIHTLFTVASDKGSMGGAPYIGPRLEDGLIFEASLS